MRHAADPTTIPIRPAPDRDLPGDIDLQTPLDNRLLTIFRALAVIRVLIALLFLLLPGVGTGAVPWTGLLALGESALLVAYLSLPPLKRTLGRAYLPLAIAWATVMPLTAQQLTLSGALDLLSITVTDSTPTIMLENTYVLGIINQTILVLIVPLIVVGWAYPRRVLWLYCAAILAADVLLTSVVFHAQPAIILVAFAFIVFRTLLHGVIGIMINQIVSVQLEQQRRLVEANARLREVAVMRDQLATSRERNRLARELHDTLAHTLSAATVQLEAVSIIWDQQPEKAHQMVTRSASMMRDGLAETRRALHALRAGPLEDESLMDALATLAASLMTRYPLVMEIQTSPGAPLAIREPSVEHGLYRIAQEAMFNAARHAQASRVTVCAEERGAGLVLSIRDDGVGFDAQASDADGHFGLRGMRERARQIGADLRIDSAPGAGTTITVTLIREGF
jgi:signal transduction histidine kinase